jgi:hypothetical protein
MDVNLYRWDQGCSPGRVLEIHRIAVGIQVFVKRTGLDESPSSGSLETNLPVAGL